MAKMTKMARGGKTNAQMKSLGRNLAKVANQRIKTKPRGRG